MSYCSKCRVHGHNLSSCRKAKKTSTIPVAQGNKQQPAKNGANNASVPLDGANQVSTDMPSDVAGAQEQWTEVKSKRDKNKKAAKVFRPKATESTKGIETFSNEEITLNNKPKHQAVRGVYTLHNIQSTKIGESEVCSQNALAMVPYVSTLKEPSPPNPHDGLAKEGPPPAGGSSQSCALEFNEETGQLYHPAMADHFNSIQEKAGSLSGQVDGTNMGYVTMRNKMKLPSGSKHCLPDRA